MRIDRLFTSREPQQGDSFRIFPRTDDAEGMIETPMAWDYAAAEAFAPALALAVPSLTKAVEENVIPSWLWRHEPVASVPDAEEYSVWHVVNRVAGSAAYNGLKLGLFTDEAAARNFYDEISLLLTQRVAALPAETMAQLGLGWAYGLQRATVFPHYASPAASGLGIDADNAALDALAAAQGDLGEKLQAILKRASLRQQVQIRFADTAREWQASTSGAEPETLRIMINLLPFWREDGLDSAGLRHAVRLLTLLAALHDHTRVAFGFCNLSSLLLMLGQPYDSEAGRNTAAALTAIISATAVHTAAELAAVSGAHLDYTAQRTTHLRVLRNRQRAAWGEVNDYDHLAILPAGILLHGGSDLALVAAAREGWDRAIAAAQEHGLYLFARVETFAAPEFAAFFGTADQGLAPLPALMVTRQPEPETFSTDLIPACRYALLTAIRDDRQAQHLQQHILGTRTLAQAPDINTASLRQLGLSIDALQRIADYLPQVTSLQQAITPQILGEAFCREKLKLTAKQLANPAFNLLAQLGFSEQQIRRADSFVFGHGQLNDCEDLSDAQRQLFATASAVPATARIAMQAALQPFATVKQDFITLPGTAADLEAMVLQAWRSGLHGLTLQRAEAAPPAAYAPKRHAAPAPVTIMPRKSGMKATTRASSLRRKPDGAVGSVKRS